MSCVEEPSGTGSPGNRRVPQRRAAVASTALTAATYHHMTLPYRAFSMRIEARRAVATDFGKPGRPRRPFPRTPPRTIRMPVGAPLLVGGGVTGSNLRAPRRRPVSSDLGFAHSGGGPRPRRNGGDVHRGTTTEPAAYAPAGAQQQLRVGPGPILTDRFRGSVPRLPRLPGSARVRGTRTRRQQAMQTMEATTPRRRSLLRNGRVLDSPGSPSVKSGRSSSRVLNIPRDGRGVGNGDRSRTTTSSARATRFGSRAAGVRAWGHDASHGRPGAARTPRLRAPDQRVARNASNPPFLRLEATWSLDHAVIGPGGTLPESPGRGSPQLRSP